MTTKQHDGQYNSYTLDETERLAFFGATGSIKTTYGDTNGGFCLIELALPPHFRSIAPHWHAKTTEAFYILEGTLAFTLAEQTFTVTRGGFVLAPPRTVHQFWNPTAAPATLLDLYTPAGFEAYFEELSLMLKNMPADVTQMMALGAKYDQFAPPVTA